MKKKGRLDLCCRQTRGYISRMFALPDNLAYRLLLDVGRFLGGFFLGGRGVCGGVCGGFCCMQVRRDELESAAVGTDQPCAAEHLRWHLEQDPFPGLDVRPARSM